MRAARIVPLLALVAFVAAPPASAAQKPKPRAVLVEADGPEEELSAFVSRLESELSDGGKATFADARLSGASLGTLVAEPEGEAARAFRAEWPGGTWLAISLSPCSVEVSRIQYRDTTPEGYSVARVIEQVRVDCVASLRLVHAATGKEAKTFSVTGTASYRRNVGEEEESSELEGTREAARKAAKKLPSLLKE